jgi:hypothetical protein
MRRRRPPRPHVVGGHRHLAADVGRRQDRVVAAVRITLAVIGHDRGLARPKQTERAHQFRLHEMSRAWTFGSPSEDTSLPNVSSAAPHAAARGGGAGFGSSTVPCRPGRPRRCPVRPVHAGTPFPRRRRAATVWCPRHVQVGDLTPSVDQVPPDHSLRGNVVGAVVRGDDNVQRMAGSAGAE